MKNYFHILGLSYTASMDEIKTAYRKLALAHHPDRGGDQEKMKEINEAYEYLVKNYRPSAPAPKRPQVVRSGFTIVVNGFGFSYADASWTTTSTGGF